MTRSALTASMTAAEPSVSGHPKPRLMEPVAAASADISKKIVVPKLRSFEVSKRAPIGAKS
jgi:hypothetical protein